MSCNDVCVSMDYDRTNDLYREVTRRAGKPHRCCECAETINVGDEHSYVIGKSEGDFFSARTCAACVEVRAAFCCDTWIFGELWEAIRDQVFPAWDEMLAIDCLAQLTTDDAVAKMRAEYAEYCEDRAS